MHNLLSFDMIRFIVPNDFSGTPFVYLYRACACSAVFLALRAIRSFIDLLSSYQAIVGSNEPVGCRGVTVDGDQSESVVENALRVIGGE